MTARAQQTAPLVSIIVAAYGRAEVLRWALDSAARQTLTDWELLVVGDACDSATADLVLARAAQDPRIRFTNLQTNYGEQSGPNNVGMARTSGRYIAFLNQDDLWFPDHLAQLVDWIEASGSDLAYGLSLHFSPRPSPEPIELAQWPTHLLGLGHLGCFDPLSTFSPASAWLVRRTCVEQLGLWRPALECRTESSQEYLYRAWKAGMRLAHCPVPTVLVFSSGARAGSYTTGHDHEQADLATRLQQDPEQVRHTLLCTAHRNAHFYVTKGSPSRWLRWGWTRLARLGLHPRALAMRKNGARRAGSYIQHLRAVRGLPPNLSAARDSADALRVESVKALCDASPGETINFDKQGASWRHRGLGWSDPEAHGCWTDGSLASIYLRLPPDTTTALLRMHMHAFTTKRHPRQRLTMLVNGEQILDTHIEDDAAHTITAALPHKLLASGGLLHVALRLPDAIRASKVKRRIADARQLGILLHSLTIEHAPPT
jgi:hypothetical protein